MNWWDRPLTPLTLLECVGLACAGYFVVLTLAMIITELWGRWESRQ